MLIQTVGGPWVKLKATNFTNASFGTLKSTLVEPSGDGVIDLGDMIGGVAPNGLLIRPFGADTNNQTAKMRVWGWAQELITRSWENILLGQYALTLGNLAGTALCAIAATDFEVDTIALTYGTTISSEVVDTHDDVRGASVMVDTKGFGKVQIEFDRNSSAASLNALYKRI